jgi:hypothetical protein
MWLCRYAGDAVAEAVARALKSDGTKTEVRLGGNQIGAQVRFSLCLAFYPQSHASGVVKLPPVPISILGHSLTRDECAQ